MAEVIEAPAPAQAPAPVAAAPSQAAPAPSPAAGPAPSPAAPAPVPITPKFSETWREDMAGTLPETASEDEKKEHGKLMDRLKRFNSPTDAAKALRENDKLLSSGALKKALPKNATEAQIKEWRKDNGVPDEAKGYDLGIPKEANLTDRDQEMLAEFAAQAHASNATPEMVQAGAKAYVKVRDAMAAQMHEANTTAKKSTEDALRAEWGHEYRTNVDGVESLLNHMGSEASEAILNARTADGVQLLNHPAVVAALAGHARELGFVGSTVVPSGGDIGKSVDDAIAALPQPYNQDGSRNDAYWKSDSVQAKYAALLESKGRRDKQRENA